MSTTFASFETYAARPAKATSFALLRRYPVKQSFRNFENATPRRVILKGPSE
jgi:hypothetical protein